MSLNQVVAAIIFHNERILCVQRGISRFPYISFKWEFPGGKVEDGEKNEIALKREIFEELEMNITVENEFLIYDYSYPDFAIKLHSYICKCDTPTFKLTEHLDYKWLLREELQQLDWSDADRPIVELLMRN
jgi:8-oxo-dGTP diphosphatase